MSEKFVEEMVRAIREELHASGDEKTRASTQRFFREEIRSHGLKAAAVTRIGRTAWSEMKSAPKEKKLDVCEHLWQSGMLEEAILACRFSDSMYKNYVSDDIRRWERWIRKYITNWATCDTFCNHTVGRFLTMFPEHLPRLMKWAKSSNRWERRAAAVSLIVPAKRGSFHTESFKIAETLLHDGDDLVQKGYGWLLKVMSQSDQQSVFEFVMDRRATMPRTALRYAIEKMPTNLRRAAMEPVSGDTV